VNKPTQFPYPDRFSFLWLAVAFVLTLFSNGNLTVPLFAWFSSIFALRFMRTCRRAWLGYGLLALATAITLAITWRGMIALPPPGDTVVIISSGLMAGIPFVVDRLLARRLPGLWATLVFPLTATALEFLNMGSGSPMGSWGATGYSQAGSLILMQIVSVTGMWGLTFVMMWLASVVNWAWERNFEWPTIWRGLALYGGVMAIVLAYGGARLNLATLEPGTVRVAALTTVSTDLAQLMPLLQSDRAAFGQTTRDIHTRYFEQTIQEARAGAKIILWAEVAGLCLEEDEPALITRARAIAQQEGIYLAIPFFTMYQDAQRPPENKLIIFDPGGQQALEHVKYGGNVFEGSKLGDGILKTIETPYGTLSGVICWDTDFIGNVAQALY
jgi:apolipoprotein N-acyltransferase